MSRFVDRVTIHVKAGSGGHGCVSVHREKFKPLGGPNGGNGGRGGNVRLVVDHGVHTLLDFHHRPRVRASNGKQGSGHMRHGPAGDDLVVPVPEGTMLLDSNGQVVVDLVGAGTTFVAARGGKGGLGNAGLASKARKAPGFALLGEPGDELDLVLELKSVADVGLVGFPSAGKSSLVSVLSAARPKIAEYPFTTLAPNLGVVSADEHTFTVADVPGLIPGASHGRGLGLDFLRHIERCAVLVHVVDCLAPEPDRNPVSDVDALETELATYTPALSEEHGAVDIASRPRLVVLNKTDVPEAAEMAEMIRPDLEQRGWRVVEVSTATRAGLRELTFALAVEVERARAERPAVEQARTVLRPEGFREAGFTVEEDSEDEDAFIVRGARPERWIRQTDFNNDEAVGYLADRLARLGVEDELAKRGARSGSPVTIGEVTFEWEPSTPAGMGTAPTSRGKDARLDKAERVGADERKAARTSRRHPTPEQREAADREWALAQAGSVEDEDFDDLDVNDADDASPVDESYEGDDADESAEDDR